jgi:hypothetical protein
MVGIKKMYVELIDYYQPELRLDHEKQLKRKQKKKNKIRI